MRKKNIRLYFPQGMAPFELLISVVIIGVLSVVIIILIERTLALKQARDITRFNHSQVILGSILRYEIDTHGEIPPGIDDDENTWQMIAIPGQPCSTECDNMDVVEKCADLSVLIPEYVDSIPQDELFTGLGGSGYYINKRHEKKIVTVGACTTETIDKIEIRQ